MEKLKLTQEQFDSAVELIPNGLVAQDKSITEAVDYVNAMNDFSAQLAFYILWNAIGKDYVLIKKTDVEVFNK